MKSILILWPSRLLSILTFIILICLSATGCHLATSTEDRSVLEHYRSTHLSGFPMPVLDLPAPKPLTTNIDEHDLAKYRGTDLIRLAKASAKSGNNSQAAAWQYLAVTKGGLGRYELSRYLARLGKVDEPSIGWNLPLWMREFQQAPLVKTPIFKSFVKIVVGQKSSSTCRVLRTIGGLDARLQDQKIIHGFLPLIPKHEEGTEKTSLQGRL